MDPQLERLRGAIRALGSAVVCFSGGVDSAFVLAVAKEVLGDRCLGLTTVSPSLPESERQGAEALARALGARHRTVDSREVEDPRYAANPVNRCYYCKSELYTIAARVALEEGMACVCNGTNVDDLGDHRPGLDAAREAEVRSPLVECGFTKADVRRCAKLLGLPVWDKPAAACLSSRIPYGTHVTPSRLSMIDRAEGALRALGLRQVRVRYHSDLARVEVGPEELERAFGLRRDIARACREAGFAYATLDLEGYRMGSHNEVVRLKVLSA
ncbi:MAG: ATP-dependent sacrificial sulfur transferase LarE [Deltaproteobacteria bacterium]|nr:ATP-dependent sacrificial sulfur transferase LarE [Deltaproteobacteria bacterium]